MPMLIMCPQGRKEILGNNGIIKLIKRHGITGMTNMQMTSLNLTDSETSTLRKVLENYLSELRMEIADTDQMDYRDELKEEEVVINKILRALVK